MKDAEAYELLERIKENMRIQVSKSRLDGKDTYTDIIREVKSDLEFVIEQTGKCQDRLFHLELGLESKMTTTWIWLVAQSLSFTALAVVLAWL